MQITSLCLAKKLFVVQKKYPNHDNLQHTQTHKKKLSKRIDSHMCRIGIERERDVKKEATDSKQTIRNDIGSIYTTKKK